MIQGFGASWKADMYTDKATQIVFNNNYHQQSNIKGIGNSIHDIWHLAQTAHFSILLLIQIHHDIMSSKLSPTFNKR